MSKKKKTMYEILEILPDASDSEIQAAHQRLTQKLQAERNYTNREDTDFMLRVVTVAFNTLSIKRTRDAYDARLAALSAPAIAPTLSLVPTQPAVDSAALKNEAMSLKAEAMSLKAEAVSLRADVMALKIESAYQAPPSISVLQKFLKFLAPVKGALTIIGSLVAIGMVIQVLFLLLVNRQAERVVSEPSKADEKVMLQDYYQQTGVRAGSKIEVDLLEAQRRREEKDQRDQQEQDRKYQQFVEESRRMGEQVSADLRRAEEQARYAEEQKKRQLEQEKREQEEAERLRIEQEKERWRRLNTSVGNTE